MSKGMRVCMCKRERVTLYIYIYVSVFSVINLPRGIPHGPFKKKKKIYIHIHFPFPAETTYHVLEFLFENKD